MHIYCDESGGLDPASEEFLVSAVRIGSPAAHRVMRQFRKTARPKIVDEVKGHQLTAVQRALFFRLLGSFPEVAAVAVVCRRSDPIGGWAMRCLDEASIWQHLVTEALEALPADGCMGVTVDRGRFSKERLSALCNGISDAVARRSGTRLKLQAGGSDQTPGLQVADIVVNTVGQFRHDGEVAVQARTLTSAAGVRVIPLRLSEVVPSWLTTVV